MKRIEIEYHKNGTTRVEAFGYTGGSCAEATREIEERHGKVKSVDYKPEFFDLEAQTCDATKLCG